VGKDKGIQFTDSNTAAYIPQVNSTEVPFPLVACPVDLIQDSLFEWTSPHHDYDYYDYYDLTLDANAIMMGDDGVEVFQIPRLVELFIGPTQV